MTAPRFTGTKTYILDPELARVVNVAIRLELPLLLKGEPGTGKTLLAHAIAEDLGMPLIQLNVKSNMKAVEALYQYDTLTRLNDSRFGDSKRNVSNIEEYIRMGKIGQAFTAQERVVLLIDEIDKADSEFQDDLLDVLDQMSFDIVEIDRTTHATHRPVIVITSNAKRDLSDPFLGRCVFHHIAFPRPEMMKEIVDAHFPNLADRIADACIEAFYRLREIDGIEKKPATRELLHWVQALMSEDGFDPKQLSDDRKVPLLGLLFKKSDDLLRARSWLNQRTA
ncbi:MAG TPA: MoxR family ATPase [bacterium]|nr:MoxR family ATPase [bacterium]